MDKLLDYAYPKNNFPKWGKIVNRANYVKVPKVGKGNSTNFLMLKSIENYDGKELVNEIKAVSYTRAFSKFISTIFHLTNMY